MKLPQLHLRDLFWLVLVVAMALGWWVHASGLRERAAVLEDQRSKLLQIASHLGVKWDIHNDVVTVDHLPEKP